MYKRSRSYSNSSWSYSKKRSAGHTAALRHIDEARKLSLTLGGTDRTVKKYLFELSGKELNGVLREYGEKYGKVAQSYAIQTLPSWRSGKVSMSGMVSERLYKLLPPRMPLSTKYDIAEELWRYVGPDSSKTLRFGPDVTVDEVVANGELHISQVVEQYKIPAELERRFNWLASHDVGVKQQLLNHLQSLDKKLVVEAVRLQTGVMIQHMLEDQAKHTRRFTHSVSVGNHKLLLVADGNARGCVLEEYRISERRISDYAWIWWVLGLGAILVLFLLSR